MPEIKEVPVPPSHIQRAPGSIVALLEERLQLYNDATNAAKELNDSSKVRRYSRAVKVSISNKFVNYIFIIFHFFKKTCYAYNS